jgi:hypothetical protein
MTGRGPAPSDERVACPDCGKVRFYHPSILKRFHSYRCNSCAQTHRRKATMGNPINTLTFAQRFKIAGALQDATEPDGAKFIRYKDGSTDAAMAERLAAELGFPVTEFNVAVIRKGVAGPLRPGMAPGTQRAEWGSGNGTLRGEIENLRGEVKALGEMVENLQKVVMRRQPTAYIGNAARVSA